MGTPADGGSLRVLLQAERARVAEITLDRTFARITINPSSASGGKLNTVFRA